MSIEIRLHGRGGQGGVTCAKILAAAYARLGKSVQTFGDYAGERSGAPVRAYTRVSDEPITNRNKVYEPDHLVVLDHHLLGADVLSGLRPGGTLLINAPSTQPLDALSDYRVATVDATEIARRRGIGTRSVVIVNTTLAGAFAQVHGIPLDVLRETYHSLGFLSNFDAACEAFEAVNVHEPREATTAATTSSAPTMPANLPDVLPLVEHVESAPTKLRTGSWSPQQPHYVENLAPCNAWCPAGNDVVGFIQAAAANDDGTAAEILGRSTPLAAVCGRVCPAPCMEGCNRSEYDGSVNIRALERWVADRVPVASRSTQRAVEPLRVAIVGGGPAGLSAAYELARSGHRPTIFEGEDTLGGILRTGIPTYRLDREVLDREIADILALGAEARCGEFLSADRLEALAEEHDAVVIATGLQSLRGLEVPGGDLEGVEQGIHFLHRVNVKQAGEIAGHVVVLGGGNTAMDCARSALRMGAEHVTVAYRRTRNEMPAIHEEIDEALVEGVEILEQRQPVAFRGNGRVASIELAEVVMGEPDESGRRRPVVTEKTVSLDAAHVLLAIGQSADLSMLPDGWELRDGRFWQSDAPLMVFAAGDLSTGDGTVTHAIGSGRRAAGLALRALGVDVEVFERPDRTRSVPATDIRMDHFERHAAATEAIEPADERSTDFREVNHGLGDALEAHRCFSCGHCTECDRCLVYCPEGIVHRATAGYDIDYSYCKGCGICVTECPRSSIEMRTE